MKTAIFSLTNHGRHIQKNISGAITSDVYTASDYANGFMAFAREKISQYDALIFVMATGIVIRAIAPVLQSKYSDPAVLVIDDGGHFVISLLSGHMGGANELCLRVAKILGATPVITTSTDINEIFAFDLLAKRNNLTIEKKENLKYISAALIDGQNVGLFSDCHINGTIPGNVKLNDTSPEKAVFISPFRKKTDKTGLDLVPKCVVLGAGCRKNTAPQLFHDAVIHFLDTHGLYLSSIKALASAEIKNEEKAFLEFCERYHLAFNPVSMEKLKSVEHEFTLSAFAKEKIGVGSVCEASAVYAYDTQEPARLIVNKNKYTGITLAAAIVHTEIWFD